MIKLLYTPYKKPFHHISGWNSLLSMFYVFSIADIVRANRFDYSHCTRSASCIASYAEFHVVSFLFAGVLRLLSIVAA